MGQWNQYKLPSLSLYILFCHVCHLTFVNNHKYSELLCTLLSIGIKIKLFLFIKSSNNSNPNNKMGVTMWALFFCDFIKVAENINLYTNSLQPFPNLENKTGPAIIDFLTKRVVALGAVQVGHFIVDCETYTSVPQMAGNFKLTRTIIANLFIDFRIYWFTVPPKVVHLLHNSEHPASVFSILESGSKQIALVADSLFDLLILKMTPAYTSKKQTKVKISFYIFEFIQKHIHKSLTDRIERSTFRAGRFCH